MATTAREQFFIPVSNVEYPKDIYLGVGSFYAGDIAVVVVDKPFVLTNLVTPVCVDWDLKYVDTHLRSGSLGKVPGWGLNIPNKHVESVDLKQITVPFIDRRQCFKIVLQDFRRYVTIDKYCAGYTNGTSVCDGDLGGGMVFQQQEYKKRKYYIQGIASVFTFNEDGPCDDHQLAFYTKVDYYIQFIKRIEASNSVECDEKPDCRDNFDEDAIISATLETGRKCLLPVFANGKYEVLENPKHVPGDPIPNFATLNFTCINDHYALTTLNNLVQCINGNFESELPKCVPSCAAILSTSIDVECELNDVKLNCSKKVPEGTVATMKCKTHYEEIGRGPPAAICSGGSWDAPLKRCKPVCGELIPKAQLLIVNGTAAKKGEFPWHVAIYRQQPEKPLRYKCGGSIISVKLVLSSARCFTTNKNGTFITKFKFFVAAGKYFRKWDVPEDTDFVQKRKVSIIEYPKDIFFGSQSNYAGDIAVVVVDEPFVLTNLVKPVCVDWDSKYVDTHLRSGSFGKVAGWGRNIPDKRVLSVDLKQITVSFVDREQCFKIVPFSFQLLITIDKYCAGYTNGTSVCIGDFGSGMVFPQEYNKKKYYIQGIQSVVPTKNGFCDDHQLAAYTKVNDYIEFLKKIEQSNEVDCEGKYCDKKKPEDCLPPVIQNGTYRLLTTDEFYTYTSEQPIPNHTLLNITCINTNYVLSTSYSTLYCEEGNYREEIPKCVLTCSPNFRTSIDVDCKYNDLKEDCTKDVREGTIAHMKCKPGFIDKNPEISHITCTKYGIWNGHPKPCSSLNMCPPRLSTAIDVFCELNGVKQDCNKDVQEGTISHMKCKTHYVDVNDGPSISIAICSNGAWSLPPKKCIPDCEEIASEGRTHIVNGGSTNRGDFPWHVAIYRQEPQKPIKYICGGSIISVKIVITAAHCLTHPSNGDPYPVSEFFVAAGKEYSEWNATEDVKEFHIPRDKYFGLYSHYAGDIAVVVLDQLFNFTNFITPVCVDWNSEIVDQQLTDGTLGKVAGWGSVTTENPTTSVKLRQLILPYVRRDKCFKIVPIRFIKFITVDKYCAGYTNGSSVCDGDSGGGMVFSRPNNYGTKVHYLQGIVSVGPTKDFSCDNFQLGVYTNVKDYIEFIREIEESNRV